MSLTVPSELRNRNHKSNSWSTVSKKGQHDSLQNVENYSLISFHVADLSLPGHPAPLTPKFRSPDTAGSTQGFELPGNADNQAVCLPLPSDSPPLGLGQEEELFPQTDEDDEGHISSTEDC